jgi:hypothetical protein
METKSTSVRLTELLAKETRKFAEKDSTLKGVYSKFSKMGIDTKSTYSLPLKDTIGKTFSEQLQSKFAKPIQIATIGYLPDEFQF